MKAQKLKCTVKSSPSQTSMSISGPMDEWCLIELTKIQVRPSKICKIDLSKIEFANSVGITHWIRYVSYLKKIFQKIEYHRCSPAFSTHLKLVSALGFGISIVSLFNEKNCSTCGESETELLRLDRVEESPPKFKRSKELCRSCLHNSVSSLMNQDDINFLSNRPSIHDYAKVS